MTTTELASSDGLGAVVELAGQLGGGLARFLDERRIRPPVVVV
jgi:hypothetical protein